MDTVAVITDSVAALPAAVANAHGIYQIPVRLTVDGRTYSDTEEDLPGPLVEKFRSTTRIDTTPWPPEHYSQMYQRIGRNQPDMVHVVAFSQFTSTISLAREGALMAREASPAIRVEVVDSATTGMAQGLVALAAARAAQQGASLENCCEVARSVAGRVVSVFALDSLDYVARTGRVNRLAAWASSLLRTTPVVRLALGKEHPLFLARSKQQAAKHIVTVVEEAANCGGPVHTAVMESDPGESETLARMLRERVPLAECIMAPFTPVMRIVGGPGVVGIAFYTDTAT